MFLNKKIGLTFLLILLFLLIGGSTAFAYTGYGSFEWFEGYVDFSLGVDFGIKMAEGSDPSFSWGFNSASFRGDRGIVDNLGGGDPSLYLSFYMTLYHGDMNTGEGGIYFVTDFMPEQGRSSALLMFFDLFGYGNHFFVQLAEQYHNLVKGVLWSGYVYAQGEFELDQDKILMFAVLDFQNNGVNENGIDNTATGITTEPGERPDSWQLKDGLLESPNVNADTWFFLDYYWFVNPTMLFFGEVGFTMMKNPYNEVDNMILGFPGSGLYVTHDIWYGSYLGVPDDEKQGFEKDYSASIQAYIHKAFPEFGIVYGYINAESGLYQYATMKGKDSEENDRSFLNKLSGEISLTAGVDMDSLKAIPGLSAEMRIQITLMGRKEITIQGENHSLTFEAIPLKAQRAEIQLSAAYTLPLPISMTPNLLFVIDLAEIINKEKHSDKINGKPLPAWSLDISWDFAFGMGEVIVPVYFRMSNIPLQTYLAWQYNPWSYRLTFGEGVSGPGNSTVDEGPDDHLRLFFGTGIKFSL